MSRSGPRHVPAGSQLDEDNWIMRALDRYERPLLRYAAFLLRDPDRARDVVQETFLRLCTQDRGALEPRLPQWLFTVCRNLVVDVRRAANARTLQDIESVDEREVATALRAFEQQALLGEILRIVDLLPANQREVVYLRFQGGFSYREISALTGLSVSYVGVLIHQAMHNLRRRVQVPSAAPVKDKS